MRIYFITLLLLMVCPLTGVSVADEKSDCLNSCESTKRSSDMYCPPAGGFTDEDNKQCLAKNSADFISCKNICSPPVASPAEQHSTPPSEQQSNPLTEQQPTPPDLPEKVSDDSAPATTQY